MVVLHRSNAINGGLAMMRTELTQKEIDLGFLQVYYPPDDSMRVVTPLEIIQMRYPGAVFDLTPSEERLLIDKAIRLQAMLLELGR